MLFGGVRRAETQLAGNFRAGGRGAGALDRVAHEVQNLLLPVGELGAGLHCIVLRSASGQGT